MYINSVAISEPYPCVRVGVPVLQSALSSRSSSTRTRVWTLISNVSIADRGQMACAWPDSNITYPMQLMGQVVHTHGPFTHVHGAMEGGSSTEAIVLSAAGAPNSSAVDPYSAYDAVRAAGLSTPPLSELYSVSFGYLPSLFQLPVDAQDKYLQIQNVTLLQLPQMARGRGSTGRRLMQQQQQQRGAGASPIGIWTIMLWGFRRYAHATSYDRINTADAYILHKHLSMQQLCRNLARTQRGAKRVAQTHR